MVMSPRRGCIRNGGQEWGIPKRERGCSTKSSATCSMSGRDRYTSPEAEVRSLLVPNNEGKVCDAMVRLLEARMG